MEKEKGRESSLSVRVLLYTGSESWLLKSSMKITPVISNDAQNTFTRLLGSSLSFIHSLFRSLSFLPLSYSPPCEQQAHHREVCFCFVFVFVALNASLRFHTSGGAEATEGRDTTVLKCVCFFVRKCLVVCVSVYVCDSL